MSWKNTTYWTSFYLIYRAKTLTWSKNDELEVVQLNSVFYKIVFYYLIRWGLLSWPWKLNNMTQQVEEQHVEDEERFKKLQVQDTANLNDRMDSLIVKKKRFIIYISLVFLFLEWY